MSDQLNLNATSELVNNLLDNAEYFADVENWALENHGFTAEGVKELLDEETGPIHYWEVLRVEEIDFEAAARSLNEEFGYEQYSKKVYLRLQAYRVDELGRERIDLSLASSDIELEGDLAVNDLLEGLFRQVEELIAKQKKGKE